MRSIKIMLTGIMLALVGVFFSWEGGLAFLGLGIVVFIIGILYDIVKKDK